MENFFLKNPLNIQNKYISMMSPNKKQSTGDPEFNFSNENIKYKNMSERKPLSKGISNAYPFMFIFWIWEGFDVLRGLVMV
jgi:hypothetical protein